jgi:hypothetical protein
MDGVLRSCLYSTCVSSTCSIESSSGSRKGLGPNRLISSVNSAADQANCPPIAADTLIIWRRRLSNPISSSNLRVYSTRRRALILPSR